MNRFEDIRDLLCEVNHNLEELKKQVEKAKYDEIVERVSKPKVKSSLEHLRSCLEYTAVELKEKILKYEKHKSRTYFPYGKDLEQFNKSLNRNLKGLSGKFYELVESIQPHKCKDDWLIILCQFTNYNKHDSLQKQERKNEGTTITKVGNTPGSPINLTVDETSVIVINGNIYSNGKVINPSGRLIVNINQSVEELKENTSYSLPIERNFEKVSFKERSTGINIVEFLDKAFVKITDFTEKIEIELKNLSS